MTRRKFVNSATSAGLVASAAGAGAAAASAKNTILELGYFRLRNGSQIQRTSDFLGKHFVPALERAGAGPIGCFGAVIGEQSPFVLLLTSYPSLDAMDSVMEKLAADKDLVQAGDEYDSLTELSYQRRENSLLRAFDAWPRITAPKPLEKGAHIFELRTYESSNGKASRRKIKMFNDAEAAIFQRLGMQPVFFGETIVGRNLPSLTYMLTFENLAAREKLWAAFGADPEWQKLRARPELADALIVSNISNTILRPMPFSRIR